MQALVDSAMRDGAMGFSTGLIYAPSTFFNTEELIELARPAARRGGGYASHIRSESDSLLPAIREAIRIGHEAGTWVEIRHLKSSGERNWGQPPCATPSALHRHSARAAGMDVTADVYPYTASGTGLSSILPSWVLAGGTDSLVLRLRDPAVRARLKTEGTSRKPHDILINTVRSDSLRRYEGMRLDAIAAERKVADPYDLAYDILIADRGSTSAIFFTMSEDDMRLALPAALDLGWPGRGRRYPGHFRTANAATLGDSALFRRYSASMCADDCARLTLENAVRKMDVTGGPPAWGWITVASWRPACTPTSWCSTPRPSRIAPPTSIRSSFPWVYAMCS